MGRPSNIVVANEDYKKLSEDYHKTLLRLGYNPRSCKSRFLYLCEFLHWLEQNGFLEITEITAVEINHYYNYISERPNKTDGGILSQKTTHAHMRNIRDLFIMLQNEKQIKINPCGILKFPYPKTKDERTVLSIEEIQQLYEVSENAKEKTILSLAYGCGLRVSELVSCNVEDVRLREKILIVPKGKGGKRRVVPMSSGVIKNLVEYYYNERNYSPKETAFIQNSKGNRMQKWTYNSILKTMIERTGNQAIKEKEITIHNLRHSIATHLLEQGISVEQVRMFLGHSQLETTQIYTHISQKQIENLI